MSGLADALVDLVENRQSASFPELLRLLEEQGHDVRGDFVIVWPSNIVAWINMSEDFTNAVRSAVKTGRVHLHLLSTMVEILAIYMTDTIPSLPLVDPEPPEDGYADGDEHWVPVVFHPGEANCGIENCMDWVGGVAA